MRHVRGGFYEPPSLITVLTVEQIQRDLRSVSVSTAVILPSGQ
ncbi:hypothetical protein NBRC3257_0692 [Gluconobacter thailandicus NBRC 3257]|uniref:Uncharacterized protein n=1 Tax=Gluconobacter thailandicus NBRC 3257 TaxID=1381097 RepID=A0ABQ0ITZ4_GLUTH|nr:hypothetical protein B932_3011 [Gluconobacter oxydans H24]GAD25693.1 hypothetical protein NBRC3257_0692 [Gluconobacter thailandicus NBRC 3257]